MPENIVCKVFNGETLVGTLTRVLNPKQTIFAYDAAYQGPTLSNQLPNKGQPVISEGLHPFFCNLISEGWLEGVQRRLIDPKTAVTRFDLLSYFGSDCIGSLRIIPEKIPERATIRNIRDMSADLVDNMHALIPGVQRKLLAIKDVDGNYVISKRKRTSTHIAKLPHENPVFFGILENEYVTTLITAALLPDDHVPDLELSSVLVKSNSSPESSYRIAPALLIERFDRTEDGQRLELYEFNQLLGKNTEDKYDGNYKEMADFIRSHAYTNPDDGIRTNAADIEVLFKRILVSFLTENSDTHLKNFALIRQGNEFRLSPNYDLVSCARYHSNERDYTKRRDYRTLALGIGMTREIGVQKLQAKHIFQLAIDFGILSDSPTPEEAGRLLAIIKQINGQILALRPVIAGNKDMSADLFPKIQKSMEGRILKSEFRTIFATVEKRRNGLMSLVEGYMAAKGLVDRQPPAPPAPENLAATATSRPAYNA